MTQTLEHAIFTQEHTRLDGWLQKTDPRIKWGMFLILALAAGLSHSFWALVILHVCLLGVVISSKLPLGTFLKRVWLGVPIFAGVVILPAIFFTSGERLFDLALGSVHFGPSWQSLMSGLIFITRVGISISLAALLILTTPWADLLKSLQSLRVPNVFILLLSMTYRYIFLLLHTANGLFEARKSRTVGRTTSQEKRRWLSASITGLLQRSFKLSNDVYTAMLARGFTGAMRTYQSYHLRSSDWLTLIATLILAFALSFLGTAF